MQAAELIMILIVAVTVVGTLLIIVGRVTGQHKEYQDLYREYHKKRNQIRSRRVGSANNGS